MPQIETYDDPMGETRRQFMQGLATLATVGEAAARWAAMGIQNRAARAERQAGVRRAATAAQRQADALAAKARAERQKMAASMDGDWLTNKASFAEAAAVWRTASVYAAFGDPVAERAAQFAEQRLRRIRPDLMDAYHQQRQAGVPVGEAMRAAARQVWEADARAASSPTGRPHGNTQRRDAITPDGPKALPTGGHGAVDDLDAAVRVEAARLAEHVRPEVLDELQRRWRATGRLPAADPIQLLRDVAGEVREAAAIGGLDGHTVEAFRTSAAGIDNTVTAASQARTAADLAQQMPGAIGTQAADHTGHTPGPAGAHTAAGPRDEPTVGRASGVTGAGQAEQPPVYVDESVDEAGPAPAWAQAFPRLRVGRVDPAVAGNHPAPTVRRTHTRGRSR